LFPGVEERKRQLFGSRRYTLSKHHSFEVAVS
jgi:hypothetical protein